MKKRKVWRYTCEFCGKSSCSGGHTASHERHCTKNPQRICRMCARVGDAQSPIAELTAAIYYAPAPSPFFDDQPVVSRKLDRLRTVSHNCPACVLAALRQEVENHEDPVHESDAFSFRDESKAWIEDYRGALVPIGCEGDTEFDREEWDAIRAKRLSKPETVTP